MMVGGRDEGKYEFGFRVVEVLILGAADVRRPPPAGAPLFKVTQLIINKAKGRVGAAKPATVNTMQTSCIEFFCFDDNTS
jgi:hypothetical protein